MNARWLYCVLVLEFACLSEWVTSSKSSSSLLSIRLVMLSKIVWSSDWYPSSSPSSSLSSSLELADWCVACSHSRQWTVQLNRWPCGGKKDTLKNMLTLQKKKKSNNANIVPGAPEGRPGLQELWCMVLTSLAAAVLLQVRSTVWAKHTTRYSGTVMARMTNRLKHLKHLQYLRQERLHDRARKLRVTT